MAGSGLWFQTQKSPALLRSQSAPDRQGSPRSRKASFRSRQSSPRRAGSRKPSFRQQKSLPVPSRRGSKRKGSPRRGSPRKGSDFGPSDPEWECYCVGDIVVLSGGRTAWIRYVGEVHFAEGEWFGVEVLKGAAGKHDGSVGHHRYFTTQPGRGLFVKEDAIRRKLESDVKIERAQEIVLKDQIVIGKSYELDDGRVGTCLFFGKTLFKPKGFWVGLSLTEGEGSHNGTVYGKSYFRCREGKGVFVRPSRIRRLVENKLKNSEEGLKRHTKKTTLDFRGSSFDDSVLYRVRANQNKLERPPRIRCLSDGEEDVDYASPDELFSLYGGGATLLEDEKSGGVDSEKKSSSGSGVGHESRVSRIPGSPETKPADEEASYFKFPTAGDDAADGLLGKRTSEVVTSLKSSPKREIEKSPRRRSPKRLSPKRHSSKGNLARKGSSSNLARKRSRGSLRKGSQGSLRKGSQGSLRKGSSKLGQEQEDSVRMNVNVRDQSLRAPLSSQRSGSITGSRNEGWAPAKYEVEPDHSSIFGKKLLYTKKVLHKNYDQAMPQAPTVREVVAEGGPRKWRRAKFEYDTEHNPSGLTYTLKHLRKNYDKKSPRKPTVKEIGRAQNARGGGKYKVAKFNVKDFDMDQYNLLYVKKDLRKNEGQKIERGLGPTELGINKEYKRAKYETDEEDERRSFLDPHTLYTKKWLRKNENEKVDKKERAREMGDHGKWERAKFEMPEEDKSGFLDAKLYRTKSDLNRNAGQRAEKKETVKQIGTARDFEPANYQWQKNGEKEMDAWVKETLRADRERSASPRRRPRTQKAREEKSPSKSSQSAHSKEVKREEGARMIAELLSAKLPTYDLASLTGDKKWRDTARRLHDIRLGTAQKNEVPQRVTSPESKKSPHVRSTSALYYKASTAITKKPGATSPAHPRKPDSAARRVLAGFGHRRVLSAQAKPIRTQAVGQVASISPPRQDHTPSIQSPSTRAPVHTRALSLDMCDLSQLAAGSRRVGANESPKSIIKPFQSDSPSVKRDGRKHRRVQTENSVSLSSLIWQGKHHSKHHSRSSLSAFRLSSPSRHSNRGAGSPRNSISGRSLSIQSGWVSLEQIHAFMDKDEPAQESQPKAPPNRTKEDERRDSFVDKIVGHAQQIRRDSLRLNDGSQLAHDLSHTNGVGL